MLAGASEVVVTDGRIEDAFAHRVATRLIAALGGQDPPDLAAALRRTQQVLRDEDPAAPWWRLRVVVP